MTFHQQRLRVPNDLQLVGRDHNIVDADEPQTNNCQVTIDRDSLALPLHKQLHQVQAPDGW